jgi:hypothetical protein
MKALHPEEVEDTYPMTGWSLDVDVEHASSILDV